MRETVKNRATAHRFAFYPPVPLVRRASSFRPAIAPDFPPTGLSTVRCPRHAMCPTDVCHSNDFTAPAPRAFPARSPDLRRADTPRSLRSPRSITGGTNVSRRPNRFGGSHRTRFPLRGASRAEAVTDLARRRGRFLPTVPDTTEPLTSLSPPTLALGLTSLRPCSLFRVSARDLLGSACGSLG
jgi:hypothetical protein